MKRLFDASKLYMTVMAISLFTSCEKGYDVVAPAMPDSKVTITTRSGNESGDVSYPVSVYLFDSNDRCLDLRTLNTADETLNFDLAAGVYSFYAVAGADASNYDMPAINDATRQSQILLKDGHQHADLMTAHTEVTLTKDEVNSMTLALQRRVLMLSSVRLEKIPSDVTAVSITLSKTYKGILMDGTMSTVDVNEMTLAKSETETGVWLLSAPQMLLLESSGATIKVSLTRNGVKKGYTYQLGDDKLKQNYKYEVTGVYTEKQTIDLTGTITGATWAGTEIISFDFDETNADSGDNSGGTGDGDGTATDNITVGSIYKDCFVLSRKDNGSSISVVLLHPNEKLGVCNKDMSLEEANASVEAAIAELASEKTDVQGWRLPTTDDAKAIYDQLASLSIKLSLKLEKADFYACTKDGVLKFFVPNIKDTARELAHITGTIHLRPVATVNISK